MALYLEAMFGDVDHPIGKYVKVEVSLDTSVTFVEDGTYVQVCLQDMEGFLDGTYDIVEFPDVQFPGFVQTCQQGVFAVKFPCINYFLVLAGLPVHGPLLGRLGITVYQQGLYRSAVHVDMIHLQAYLLALVVGVLHILLPVSLY